MVIDRYQSPLNVKTIPTAYTNVNNSDPVFLTNGSYNRYIFENNIDNWYEHPGLSNDPTPDNRPPKSPRSGKPKGNPRR